MKVEILCFLSLISLKGKRCHNWQLHPLYDQAGRVLSDHSGVQTGFKWHHHLKMWNWITARLLRWCARIYCLEQTCVQFPPVDLAEEGVSPELVTRAVLEAESLVRFFHQQTLADGPGPLTELLRIHDWIVQDPLLHHLILHLREQERFFFYSSRLQPAL